MLLNGEVLIDAPASAIWMVFMDPALLCRAMPACQEAHRIDDLHYEATLATRIKLITVSAHCIGELLEAVEPTQLVVGIEGEIAPIWGHFRAGVTVDLAPQEGETLARYRFEAEIFGRAGNLSEPLIRSTAHKLAVRFGNNVAALTRDFAPP